ncbi:MAG: hypothetical protein KKB31_00510 [Nanoarchaeota archaeon]|nr:hypothetical protein [Nanoarchaeota archaeon]
MQNKIYLFLLILILISFVSAKENCVLIEDFIDEHYDNNLVYNLSEFENLKNETNLSTSELKDYLINFEEKCNQIVDDYNPIIEKITEHTIREKIINSIKLIFEKKNFLMFVCVVLLSLIVIKMILP